MLPESMSKSGQGSMEPPTFGDTIEEIPESLEDGRSENNSIDRPVTPPMVPFTMRDDQRVQTNDSVERSFSHEKPTVGIFNESPRNADADEARTRLPHGADASKDAKPSDVRSLAEIAGEFKMGVNNPAPEPVPSLPRKPLAEPRSFIVRNGDRPPRPTVPKRVPPGPPRRPRPPAHPKPASNDLVPDSLSSHQSKKVTNVQPKVPPISPIVGGLRGVDRPGYREAMDKHRIHMEKMKQKSQSSPHGAGDESDSRATMLTNEEMPTFVSYNPTMETIHPSEDAKSPSKSPP